MDSIGFEIEEVLNVTRSMKPVDVLLDTIKPNPLNNYTEDDIEDLAFAIRQQGLLQPLIAVEEGRDGYRLIGGHRRLKALIYNRDNFGGPAFAACLVLDNVQPEEEEAAIVFANSQRVKTQADITMEVTALRRLHEAKKTRGEDVAPLDKYIGGIMKLSDSTINRHLSIEKNLTGEAKEKYMSNKISFKAAGTLASLPSKEQKTIVEKIEKKALPFSQPQIEAEHRALASKKKTDIIVSFKTSELKSVMDVEGKTVAQLKAEVLKRLSKEN